MSAVDSQSEIRLVVLGRAGAGKRSAVSTILDLQDPEQDTDAPGTHDCSKHRGEAAGRQVVVVSSPDWFSSGCDSEERRKHISSFITLSSPGPHAFLLCVPVNQPADGEAKALDVLQELFGSSAVSSNTFILFTHTEELDEDEQLEEYLVTWRKDLQALVERCGDHYHTLETRSGEPEERKAVEELLEKVEAAVRESETQHFSCPLYQEAEERVRARQEEIVRQRRAEQLDEQTSPTDSNPEENLTDEEMERVREEAERSVADLNVDVDSIFPSTSVSSSHPPSFLWGLWEKMAGWMRWMSTLVRREALLGALVGLFVGGPFGGMVGATVGSVATEEQLNQHGKLDGYKFMHLKCIQSGLVVTQRTVRHMLKILDPEGVQLRQRNRLRRRLYTNPGPNFLWHVDSYDKLKPYGICINGAVDGFSRMVMWLHAYTTNSNPKVISGYFIDEVEGRSGTPTRIRADLGTENRSVEQMQMFLRGNHGDQFSERCYITGSSNHNQRIEQWWGFLRKHHAQYWMNVFQDLKDHDHFSGDFIDKNLIQFTCLEIIERELQDVAHLWNCHRIRPSRSAVSPSGRPLLMHSLPHLFGTTDYIKAVSPQQIQACREECLPRGPHPCDETVFDICCLAMSENYLHPPTSSEEATELYFFLRAYIHTQL